MSRLLLDLVRALPRRALSRATGAVVRTPWPSALLRPALALYARRYGANLAEAGRPLGAYATFQEFFTRPLVAGARPTDPDPSAVVSPADGRVHDVAPVVRGSTVVAKGVPYSVAELLGDAAAAADLEGGQALTIHLAPGDYHRYHWPLDGTFDLARHLPGDLWPVHARAVAEVPRLFARNERVACLGRTAGGARFAFVAVGALNVGSIRLAFLPWRTDRGAGARNVRAAPLAVAGRRGDELGWFEMGSSIVLLLAPGAGTLDPLAPGTVLRVGRRVGRLP